MPPVCSPLRADAGAVDPLAVRATSRLREEMMQQTALAIRLLRRVADAGGATLAPTPSGRCRQLAPLLARMPPPPGLLPGELAARLALLAAALERPAVQVAEAVALVRCWDIARLLLDAVQDEAADRFVTMLEDGADRAQAATRA